MNIEQTALLIILTVTLVLFIIGKPRYDLVSFIALLFASLIGIVPLEKTFTGFSHSAVITVIAIFVISSAIEETGLLENLAYQLKLQHKVIWKQVGLLCLLVVIISSIINNVGAVALLIPVSLKVARIKNIPRGYLLMPLAFSSLLGGLITLIGTPSNLIISQYRYFYRLHYFNFFDFTPVGVVIAIVGLAFVSIIGWKMIPLRKREKEEAKPVHEKFMIELSVPKSSLLAGRKGAEVTHYQDGKIHLHSIVREEEFQTENLAHYTIKADDILIIETDKWTLRDFVQEFRLSVISRKDIEMTTSYTLSEITLLPHSNFLNRSVSEINESDDMPFVVLAVSRSGEKISERINGIRLIPGDVLLVKSRLRLSKDEARKHDCLLIEETKIQEIDKVEVGKALGLFGIGLMLVIFRVLNVDVAFMSVAVLMILIKCVSLKKAYQSINWPIIVLLGTLIPVGEAMETTGLAKLVSVNMYTLTEPYPLWVSLYILLTTSMILSNIMNNAAVAVVFAPIAATFASYFDASIDPFLMAIAVGSSSTFLTPIGHQSNALVFGAGKYQFSDYWHMGLPLSIIVSIVATAMITWIWPFYPS